MKSRMFLITMLLVFLIVGSVDAYQDEYQEEGTYAIKTESGIFLAWNIKDNYFTIEIFGKDVRPDNSTSHVFLNVDGIVLQIQAAAISELGKAGDIGKQNNASILISHRDWEAKYLEGEFNKKITVKSSPLKLKNGTDALAWNFDMPREIGGEARKQLFLTTVNGKYVIVLNGVVTDGVDEEAVRKLLVDTMATFKSSPKPFDVKKLQESISKPDPR
jgi:hypothetical protein